jgi:succinate dehydrogenase cytochrome b subunit
LVSDVGERSKNRKGVAGWLNPYHYNLERWAYVLHRVTGVGILLYVVGHLGDTSFFVGGPTGSGPSEASWAFISGIVENSFGHLVLVLVALIVFFHGANGVRLILAEFGLVFKRPSPIEYPYRAKSQRPIQRYMFWFAVFVAGVAGIWAWSILFGWVL